MRTLAYPECIAQARRPLVELVQVTVTAHSQATADSVDAFFRRISSWQSSNGNTAGFSWTRRGWAFTAMVDVELIPDFRLCLHTLSLNFREGLISATFGKLG